MHTYWLWCQLYNASNNYEGPPNQLCPHSRHKKAVQFLYSSPVLFVYKITIHAVKMFMTLN